jgi:hypothetical protein
VAWQDDSKFATVGAKHIKFWRLEGRNLKYTKGKLSEVENVGVTSIVFFKDFWVTGLANGTLSCWKPNGQFMGARHPAHDKGTPVTVLLHDQQNNLIYSGISIHFSILS